MQRLELFLTILENFGDSNDNEIQELITESKRLNNSKNNYNYKRKLERKARKKITEINPTNKFIHPHYQLDLEVSFLYKIKSMAESCIDRDKFTLVRELIIKEAIKIEATYLVYELSKTLYTDYNILYSDNNKSKKFFKILTDSFDKITDLHKSRLVYTELASHCSIRKQNIDKWKKGTELFDELEQLKKKQQTNNDYRYNYFVYCSIYLQNLLQNNQNIEDLCIEAINFFKSKMHLSPIGYASFLIKLGFFYQSKRRYSEAIKSFEKVKELNLTIGASIWLNLYNHLTTVLIHSQNYSEAHRILSGILRKKERINQSPIYQEPIRIKSAYLHLLKAIGKFEVPNDTSKKFRINKFLNEVPLYSKDKRGINIPILIIHVLYLFLDKKYDLILNRLEALNTYSFKYLRNDETLRSNAFIKILMQLPRADYHPIRFKRYSEKYYKRIENAPQTFGLQALDVEIIPYEQLWEIVIEMLELRLAKKI